MTAPTDALIEEIVRKHYLSIKFTHDTREDFRKALRDFASRQNAATQGINTDGSVIAGDPAVAAPLGDAPKHTRREGCHYWADAGSVCNKCGKVHPLADAAGAARDAERWQDGIAGNCNVVKYVDGDIIGICRIDDDSQRAKIIAIRNELSRSIAALTEVERMRDEEIAGLREKHGNALIRAEKAEAAVARLTADAKPVAWIRYCSDGTHEGPLVDSVIDGVRKKSGAWTPLYARPAAPSAEQTEETKCQD